MNPDHRVAVVTGGNRGLGYFVCRDLARLGLTVLLTSRDTANGEAAGATMRDEGLNIHVQKLDVTKDPDIRLLENRLRSDFGRLDVLVNNAGIKLELGDPSDVLSFAYYRSAFDVDVDTIRRTLETNLYGPYRMIQTLAPLMVENGYGRIVNVSSGGGRFSENIGGNPGYRTSKATMNVMTICFAAELARHNILVNRVCPGWASTDMGGPRAWTKPEDSVDTIVWLATLPDGGPTAGFFRDREPISW